MVRITEQLIRKKSEHNESIIGTLEELSLHQEDIEKIELIQNYCKHLQILLLQNNLIGKIENLHKLKSLTYLNLAINNIEYIENLEQLESLQKLDLTLNFIGELTDGLHNLQSNIHLTELILTGNPCTDFKWYRDYTISTLPQLQHLDGIEIKRSDQLMAKQNLHEKHNKIIQLQIEYAMERDAQKIRVQLEELKDMENCVGLSEDEIAEKFWSKKSEHCPETRLGMARQHRKRSNSNVNDQQQQQVIKSKEQILFANCGRPYNVNQSKLKFQLHDEPGDHYELTLYVYRYLDTSLICIDLQTNYVRVTIKQKIFQLALANEIKLDASTSKRSQTTGHLVIFMPKLNYTKTMTFPQMSKDKLLDDGQNYNGKFGDSGINDQKSKMKSTLLNSPSVNYRKICQPSEEIEDITGIPDLI